MSHRELVNFILESNKAGYAEGDLKKWAEEADGSTTITCEKGIWKSHDNFFGGEPYGGRIVVSRDDRPCWIMLYYGWVNRTEEIQSVFSVLRNALKKMPQEHPFRGPREYCEMEYAYSNTWNGIVSRFHGKEIITKNDELMYQANYFGGLVDSHDSI